MADKEYFPPASFYFGLSIGGKEGVDSMWQEVSGIEVESDVEEIIEGGENDHTHRVPGRVKYKNLVLKRGLAPKSSTLVKWCEDRFADGNSLDKSVDLKDIIVSLYNEKGEKKPIATWTFDRAYPVKWSISNFNAQENALAVETIEFAYRTIKKTISF